MESIWKLKIAWKIVCVSNPRHPVLTLSHSNSMPLKNSMAWRQVDEKIRGTEGEKSEWRMDFDWMIERMDFDWMIEWMDYGMIERMDHEMDYPMTDFDSMMKQRAIVLEIQPILLIQSSMGAGK